jgi:hypothetical protein
MCRSLCLFISILAVSFVYSHIIPSILVEEDEPYSNDMLYVDISMSEFLHAIRNKEIKTVDILIDLLSDVNFLDRYMKIYTMATRHEADDIAKRVLSRAMDTIYRLQLMKISVSSLSKQCGNDQ